MCLNSLQCFRSNYLCLRSIFCHCTRDAYRNARFICTSNAQYCWV